jgi:hypothetical protein
VNWKLHAPLLKVVATTTITYAAVLSIHWRNGQVDPAVSWNVLGWIMAGGFYTHLFEYFYHSWLMHRVFRIGKWRFVDTRHRAHHRIFLGDSFQTRRPENLVEVATKWYTFPALFVMHYAAFRALLPAPAAPAFFLGVTMQFLAYEVTHWLTHLQDNVFDRWVTHLPVLGEIRRRQIAHHRLHHLRPDVNFNFTPPYAGDRIGRTRAA